MDLYSQLNNIVKDNFVDGEVNLENLIISKSLYFITEERKIFFIGHVININLKHRIASICFIKDHHFYLVATSTDFKRQGYAFDLFKSILDVIKNATLHVRNKNESAKQLYHKLGFKQTNFIPHLYDCTTDPDDGIEMSYVTKESFLGF